MLTMRAAASLLSSARTAERLEQLVRATGIASIAAPLPTSALDDLGVRDVSDACLVAGRGAVRVLIARCRGTRPFRDALRAFSRTLSARAPHILWIVAAVDRDASFAALLGWTGNGEGALRLASFIWEPARVVDSDAETLCALSAVRVEEDVLFHVRCVEVLGRDALTRRFYRALRSQVDALAGSLPRLRDTDAREISLLYTSRLLFLCFLEAKGWLDRDRAFVASRFDDTMRSGGGFHHRVLLPLFFGTLNTPASRRSRAARDFGAIPFLNGGLFARTPVERRLGAARFSDERLGALLDELFLRFRFVAREDSATWSEASIDPEMLGRAFESLMAAHERRAAGVYYTPHELVSRVAEEPIARFATSLHAARAIRLLDPACGSGAFLVYALERLTTIRRELGETLPAATIRRDVLARSIFGVDLSPTAVWLCELRLWLSVVIESHESDPRHVVPLPNLDRNIRVGDALAGPAFAADATLLLGGRRVLELRQRYLRATGVRKKTIARALDREERCRLLAQLDSSIAAMRHARSELLAAMRGRDLFGERPHRSIDRRRELRRLRDDARRLRAERMRVAGGGALPFSFGACFADVQARGGFDVVLGNPPWVRLHRIPVHLRAQLKRLYRVYRDAAWRAGAERARAGPGFASQVDLAALFVERSLSLLRPGGLLSLLLPLKLWRSLAGGGVRRLLIDAASVLRLEDWSQSPHAFDAAVYPSILFAARDSSAQGVEVIEHRASGRRDWQHDVPHAMAFDATPGAPWIFLHPGSRASFDRIRGAGVPLAATPFGAPRLGVKSGCNAAFVVRLCSEAHGLAIVEDANGQRGTVECALLRPALRGDAITPWTRTTLDEAVLWTHDAAGAPLARLPTHAGAWLRRWHGDLAHRSDARASRRWWSLFRTDAGDSSRARVVWADIGRRPRALVLPVGDPAVPLNTCYVIGCATDTDAWALAALLNSPLAAAWLNALAEPARGGYRRYMAWTVGLLPIPRDWARARAMLADAARQPDDVLLAVTLDAFRLRHLDVRDLLADLG